MMSKTVRLLVEVGVGDGVNTYEVESVKDFVEVVLSQYYTHDFKVSLVPVTPEDMSKTFAHVSYQTGLAFLNCPVCGNELIADIEDGESHTCRMCHAVDVSAYMRVVVEVNGSKALEYRAKAEPTDTNTASDPE
jgi:hypothetical protein